MSLRDLFVEIGTDIDVDPLKELDDAVDAVKKALDNLDGTNPLDDLMKDVDDAAKGFDDLDKEVKDTDNSIDKLDNKGLSKIDKDVSKAEFGFKKLGKSIVAIGAAIGVFKLVQKGVNMITGAIDGAIDRVDTLNRFPVVMERMGFGADVAKESIDRLSDGIQGLPTTLDGIVSNTQSIALLTGDLEKATDSALALNNAFLASGSDASDAERGLRQYTQMLSKGKVDAQSWYTLQETMGYALNEVAEAFGYTGKSAQNDFYDALQSGFITFDEFNDKIIELNDGVGGFAEIAKDSTSGIGTSIANMKTAVVRGVADIIQSINDVLAETPLESIENVIGMMGKSISNTLSGIAAAIPAVVSFFTPLFDAFDRLKDYLSSFGTESEGLSHIGEGFANAFNKAKDVIGQFVEGVIMPLLPVAQEYMSAFFNYSNSLVEGAMSLFDALSGIIRGLVDNVIVPLFPVAQGVISTVMEVISPLVQVLGTLFERVSSAVKFLVEEVIVPLLPLASIAIHGAWIVIEPVLNQFKGAFDAIGSAIQWVIDKVSALAGALSNLKIGDKISGIVSKVGSWAGAPGFSSGLGRVPYDDMPAVLHKDEAVIPADEADALRDAGILKSDGRYPEIDLGGDGDSGGNDTPILTTESNSRSVTVNAPVTLVVQGGNTDEETGSNLKETLDAYFDDLNVILEG